MRDFSKYILELPEDHIEALHQICTDFFDIHAENHTKYADRYESFMRHEYQMFFKIASKFVSEFKLDFNVPESANGNENILYFFNEFDILVSGWLAEQFFELKYSPNTDSIRFSQENVKSLQNKTNELRDIVTNAKYLEEGHRIRLLRRLEKFQAQLHLPISRKDVFMAGWVEVNDMIEDTGNKSKPIADRFREIISAVRSREQIQIGADGKPKQITDQSETDTEE